MPHSITTLKIILNAIPAHLESNYHGKVSIQSTFQKYLDKNNQCFQQTFQKQKRDFIEMDSQENSNQDEADKKIWKEHAEILKRYANVFRSAPRISSSRVGKCNKEFAEKTISKDRRNLFLKKIIEKGANMQYDEKSLQEQILQKLALINEKKVLTRSQTAKTQFSFKKNTNFLSQSNNLESSYKKHRQSKKITSDQLQQLKNKDYLMFDSKQDILKDYKKRIQAVDCSISTKKILQTTDVLKQMQKIIDSDFQNHIQ